MIRHLMICANGHKLLVTKGELILAKKKKVVCVHCNTPLKLYKKPTWSGEKEYICRHFHVTTVTPFKGDQINLSFSDQQFCNFKSSPEEFVETVKAKRFWCLFPGCDGSSSLEPLDETPLKVPELMVAKTKTRVGDIWEQAKCPEPKVGSYDKEGNFIDTDFNRRQKERIRKMRRPRVTKPVGPTLVKPTQKNYKVSRPSKDEE